MILLGTTLLFAFFAVTFGYQLLLSNYQYWTCWNSCVFDLFADCGEVCNDVAQENKIELTQDEQIEKSKQVRDMYGPILEEHRNAMEIPGGIFSSGYSHPDSLEDNLEGHIDYSDGFFRHFQEFEIVSPLSDSSDAGTVIVLKAMIFPEMWVFWAFVLGVGGFVGYRIQK